MKRYGLALPPATIGTEGLGLLPPNRGSPLNALGELIAPADLVSMSMPFNYFANFFLFWRGDIRLRIRSLTNLKQVSLAYPDTGAFNFAAGSAYTYGSLNPDLTVEIPFQSTLPYHFIYNDVQKVGIDNNDLIFPAIAGGFSGLEILSSAGDNFLCGHLMPPPNFLVSIPPALVSTSTTTTGQDRRAPPGT